MNTPLPKLSLVLNAALEDDLAYIDNSPRFAIIPLTKDALRTYLTLLEHAKTSRIPNLNALCVRDYSPCIVNHDFEKEHDLPTLDLLPREATQYLDEMYLIPTPSPAELEKHSVRVELSELQVPTLGSMHYTGYLKHTNLRYSTSSLPENIINVLITELEQLEAKAEAPTIPA